jgi:hypothetical protein
MHLPLLTNTELSLIPVTPVQHSAVSYLWISSAYTFQNFLRKTKGYWITAMERWMRPQDYYIRWSRKDGKGSRYGLFLVPIPAHSSYACDLHSKGSWFKSQPCISYPEQGILWFSSIILGKCLLHNTDSPYEPLLHLKE